MGTIDSEENSLLTNLTQSEMTQEVMIGTIREVKDFLDGELFKNDYKDCHDFVRVLFKSEHAYNQAKRKNDGVGENTIYNFLKEAIPLWRIRSALDSINKAAPVSILKSCLFRCGFPGLLPSRQAVRP